MDDDDDGDQNNLIDDDDGGNCDSDWCDLTTAMDKNDDHDDCNE